MSSRYVAKSDRYSHGCRKVTQWCMVRWQLVGPALHQVSTFCICKHKYITCVCTCKRSSIYIIFSVCIISCMSCVRNFLLWVFFLFHIVYTCTLVYLVVRPYKSVRFWGFAQFESSLKTPPTHSVLHIKAPPLIQYSYQSPSLHSLLIKPLQLSPHSLLISKPLPSQ